PSTPISTPESPYEFGFAGRRRRTAARLALRPGTRLSVRPLGNAYAPWRHKRGDHPYLFRRGSAGAAPGAIRPRRNPVGTTPPGTVGRTLARHRCPGP